MYINKYLSIFAIFLSILTLASCKLLSPDKDTTAPEIQLTIAGANEISRGVTLYLDIEDDSKIDYVSVIIDDTTAITVESNFDTIRFDVTPFADESEHQLYAKVADSEGNIGESEKIDIIITEYPGWRIYGDVEINNWAFNVDDNSLIWYGMVNSVNIFDPESNTLTRLNPDNSPLNGEFIENIKVIEGSRVWILSDRHLYEYHYELDRWIKEVELPLDSTFYFDRTSFRGLAIDSDYNVWVGALYGGPNQVLLKYDHVNIWSYSYSNIWEITDIEVHPDGTIYLGGDPGVDYLRDNKILSFADYPYSAGDGTPVVIDSIGNVWSTAISTLGGCSRFNGDIWENILMDNSNRFLYPTFTGSNGIIYFIGNHSIITYNGNDWFIWDNTDSPFNSTLENTLKIWGDGIAEAPNGDIWMVAGEKLMRYRPSLGGYP